MKIKKHGIDNNLLKKSKIYAKYFIGGWAIDLKYNSNRMNFVNKYYYGVDKKAIRKTTIDWVDIFCRECKNNLN